MPDIEKVKKGLETCYCPPAKCEDCPYHDLPDEQSCNDTLCLDALYLLKGQEAEIRQLKLALDIAKGTCKGIKYGGGQFADMPTMQSAT